MPWPRSRSKGQLDHNPGVCPAILIWLSKNHFLVIVIASSIADLAIIAAMSVFGICWTPLPFYVVLGVFAAAAAPALVLDQVKVAIFRWLRMSTSSTTAACA